MRKNKGFTLIELLATITILSLVFVVVGTIIFKAFEPGKEKATKITWTSIKQTALAYSLEPGNDVMWTQESGGDFTCTTINYLIRKGYLKDNLVEADTNKKIPTNQFIKIFRDENKVSTVSIDVDDIKSCDTSVMDFEVIINGDSKKIDDVFWYYDSGDSKVKTKIEIVDVPFSGISRYEFEIKNAHNSENVFDDDGELILSDLIGNKSLYGKNTKVCGRVFNGHGVDSDWKCKNVSVDFVPPSCEIPTNQNEIDNWISDDLEIKQGCSDMQSGCDAESFDSQLYDYSIKTAVFKNKTIKDNVGNLTVCGSYNVNVFVDKTIPEKPLLTASDNIASGKTHYSVFNLNISGGYDENEIYSGFYYEYRLNDSSEYIKIDSGNKISNISKLFNLSGFGDNYYVRTCNYVGKCSDDSNYNVLLTLPPDPPVLTASDGVSSGEWHNTSSFMLYVDKENVRNGVYYNYKTSSYDKLNKLSYNYSDDFSELLYYLNIGSSYHDITIFIQACYISGTKTCSEFSEYLVKIDNVTLNAPTVIASDGVKTNNYHKNEFNLTIRETAPYVNAKTTKYFKYTLDDGDPQRLKIDNNIAYINNISTDGTYKFWICIEAGFCSEEYAEYVAKFDNTPPEIENENSTSASCDSNISADISDSPSGQFKHKYTNSINYSNDNWSSLINNNSVSYNVKKNGTYYIWAQDALGNYSKSNGIKVEGIDDKSPVCNGGSFSLGNIVRPDCTDDADVTYYYLISNSNSTPNEANSGWYKMTGKSTSYTYNCGKTYYGYIKAVDECGNVTIKYVGGVSSSACPEYVDACCNGSCSSSTTEWPAKTFRPAGYFSGGRVVMVVVNYPSHYCNEWGYSYMCSCYR